MRFLFIALGASLGAVTLASPGLAAPQGIDARSNGMGGAQVASADYRNAGFANPALLTRHKPENDWGLVLPTVSAIGSDPEDLVDTADAFVAEFDRIEAIFDMAGTPTQADLDSLATSLLDLDERTVVANGGAGLSFAMPSEDLGFAVVVDSRLTARSFIDVDPADAAAIMGSLGGGALPDLLSNGVVTGALVTDYGIALAHAFQIGTSRLSIGITPKAQKVETFNYRVDADDFDEDDETDDFTDERFREEESGFNIDAGLLFQPSDRMAVGLAVRNLIARDIESVTTLGHQFTYSLEPTATVGASWTTAALTLAADVDLTKTEPFDFAPGSQFLSVGAEMAWRWGQVRGGYRSDIEDEVESVVTGGLGFSPWDVFHIDLAAAVGPETFGASVQLGWSF